MSLTRRKSTGRLSYGRGMAACCPTQVACLRRESCSALEGVGGQDERVYTTWRWTSRTTLAPGAWQNHPARNRSPRCSSYTLDITIPTGDTSKGDTSRSILSVLGLSGTFVDRPDRRCATLSSQKAGVIVSKHSGSRSSLGLIER